MNEDDALQKLMRSLKLDVVTEQDLAPPKETKVRRKLYLLNSNKEIHELDKVILVNKREATVLSIYPDARRVYIKVDGKKRLCSPKEMKAEWVILR